MGILITVAASLLLMGAAVPFVAAFVLLIVASFLRASRVRCTCCTAGDSCDCERHCARHGRDPMPAARVVRR